MDDMPTMSELAMVVEDDEDLAAIFTEALQKANYEVETVRDGLSAQRRIIQIEPHLVVLDMHIPYVSGGEILQQIRADVRLKRTTVVIATADARMGEMYTEIADFVLIKPITFTQLRDLVNRLHRI
jgi:two-component system, cell cycle response regulator DivK